MYMNQIKQKSAQS